MRIKRFNESFDADYIQIGDFETTIEVDRQPMENTS